MNMNMKCYVTHNLFMLDIEVIFIIHIYTEGTEKQSGNLLVVLSILIFE